MSFDALRAAIQSRFQDEYGSTTPVFWDNVPASQPAPPAPYVAIFILDGEGGQISLATNPLHRFAGVIDVQIFVPEKTGTSTAKQIADTISAIWRDPDTNQGVQFFTSVGGEITCRPSNVVRAGAVEGWLQLNCRTAFKHDFHHGP